MTKTAFLKEVVSLLHQLGPQSADQLQTHLPEHTLLETYEALLEAQRLGFVQESSSGVYTCLEAGMEWADPRPGVMDIVSHALSVRSPLELAWASA